MDWTVVAAFVVPLAVVLISGLLAARSSRTPLHENLRSLIGIARTMPDGMYAETDKIKDAIRAEVNRIEELTTAYQKGIFAYIRARRRNRLLSTESNGGFFFFVAVTVVVIAVVVAVGLIILLVGTNAFVTKAAVFGAVVLVVALAFDAFRKR